MGCMRAAAAVRKKRNNGTGSRIEGKAEIKGAIKAERVISGSHRLERLEEKRNLIVFDRHLRNYRTWPEHL